MIHASDSDHNKQKGNKHMNVKKVFVVGAGFMGSGIVENVAAKGLEYGMSTDSTYCTITSNSQKTLKPRAFSDVPTTQKCYRIPRGFC